MNVTSLARALAAASVSVVVGCGPSHRLNEFVYADRTVAVVSQIPRRPEVLSGPLFFGGRSGDPIRDMLRVGAQIAREAEARALRARLDSAATRIDVGYVLEERALERTARYLGADAVERDGSEDYVLELVVAEYGIDAEGWESTAYFFIDAEAALLHAGTGTEIWRAEIEESESIGPRIWGPGRGVGDIVTAASLGDLTVDEIVTAFESLAEYAATRITNRLSEDLREARREGR